MDWTPFFTGIGVAAFLFLGLALWRASVVRDRAAGKADQWRAKEERFRDEILERHDEGLVAQERQAEALQDIAALLKSRVT
jgi:hypothetical protein